MSLTLSTNLSSIITQRSLKQSSISLNQAIERMTTGYKINHAKDNAANYSIATNLSSKISAYEIAESNASMGLDMVQTASEALSTMSNLTSRLRALAVTAQNGTYGGRSLEALQKEADSITKELARINNNIGYNNVKVFQEVEEPAFISKITRKDTSSMIALEDVDENTAITSGTYSISTPEELVKLRRMNLNGKITQKATFVLADNIDLSGYSSGTGWEPIGTGMKVFSATFDGNGYTISNLYINSNGNEVGLFGYLLGANIKNLVLENANVSGRYNVGALVGNSGASTVTNCAVINSSVSGIQNIGGLAGNFSHTSITDSYSTGRVSAKTQSGKNFGGLVGAFTNNYSYSIKNSYSTCDVSGAINAGGLIGYNNAGGSAGSNIYIMNSYAAGRVSGIQNVGGFVGYQTANKYEGCYYNQETTGQSIGCGKGDEIGIEAVSTKEFAQLIESGNLPLVQYSSDDSVGRVPTSIVLQVGHSSAKASQISFDVGYVGITSLNGLVICGKNALTKIDKVIEAITKEETYLGALENRLTSALEEISINYENLVSSRSTIKDADIAEVSSEYIRNQILQQASATLMSTANQTPAIALRLL